MNSFSIGKPSTYPLRTAQRNLNKILLGNEDDLGSECDSQRTSTVVSSQGSTQSAKTIFELDALISNVFSDADAYIQSSSSSSSVMQSSNAAAIAKDMNSSAMRSITQNSQNSSSALKNDVKLSEYSEFAPLYAQMQQPIQSVDMHSASKSQPTHSQSSTNDGGHLSKIFGDDDTSMLLNNNNHKSVQNGSDQHTQVQLPTTPQPNRLQSSLISDMVNFSPMNGIMSQDNASGE